MTRQVIVDERSWLHVAAIVVGLLAAAWTFAVWTRAQAEPPAPEWARLSESVVVTAAGDETSLRFAARGWDADGNEIPPQQLADVAAWRVAGAEALITDPADLRDWGSCDPRDCVVAVPTGSFVYFTKGEPGLMTHALDTGSQRLFIHTSAGWAEVEDAAAYLRHMPTVRP